MGGANRSRQASKHNAAPSEHQETPQVDAEAAESKKPFDASKSQEGGTSQDIFAVRTALFLDPFIGLCEKEMVEIAVMVVVDPKIQKGPLIYTHGHHYDVAKILAALLRQLKTQIAQDLDA